MERCQRHSICISIGEPRLELHKLSQDSCWNKMPGAIHHFRNTRVSFRIKSTSALRNIRQPYNKRDDWSVSEKWLKVVIIGCEKRTMGWSRCCAAERWKAGIWWQDKWQRVLSATKGGRWNRNYLTWPTIRHDLLQRKALKFKVTSTSLPSGGAFQTLRDGRRRGSFIDLNAGCADPMPSGTLSGCVRTLLRIRHRFSTRQCTGIRCTLDLHVAYWQYNIFFRNLFSVSPSKTDLFRLNHFWISCFRVCFDRRLFYSCWNNCTIFRSIFHASPLPSIRTV